MVEEGVISEAAEGAPQSVPGLKINYTLSESETQRAVELFEAFDVGAGRESGFGIGDACNASLSAMELGKVDPTGRLFSKLDTDGGKSVDIEEWLEYLRSLKEERG